MRIYKGLVMGLVSYCRRGGIGAASRSGLRSQQLCESSFSGCYRVSAFSLRGAFGVSSLLPSADIYKLRRCLSSRTLARPWGSVWLGGRLVWLPL